MPYLGLQALEELGGTFSKGVVFAHQGVSGQHTAQARVALREHQYQVHQLLEANPHVLLFLQDHLTAGEHGLFSELDKRLEHFPLAGKMAIQSSLGNAHGFGEAGGGDSGTRIGLQEFHKSMKNRLAATGFLISHGRTAAL